MREKCLNNPEIVENTSLMHQLDELIVILRDSLIKDARCIEGHMECIKLVSIWIKEFKEDIKVIKCDDKMQKAGGVNLINEIIKFLELLEPVGENLKKLLEILEALFDNGFEEIVSVSYEVNKEYKPLSVDGISKDEFIANAPKYDVRNVKFIKS